MIDLLGTAPAWGYGPKPTIARARFAASASTGVALALLDAQGIKSIVQTGPGLFTATLADKLPDFTAIVQAVAATHATFHDCPVFAVNLATGTFQFAHYSAARGSTELINDGVATASTFNIIVIGRGGI